DPNSFSDGIGQTEYGMLRDDDHVPLRDKALKGLFPPGSTVKPMVSLALLRGGIDPEETVRCGGGLRVGNRFFNCHSNHGTVDMMKANAQSCDTYFYKMALRVGYDSIALMARELGLGAKYELPVASQSYGTVPDTQWIKKRHEREWADFDTVNSAIGQGYFLTNPLQLCVMAARMASGRKLEPHLLYDKDRKAAPPLDISPEHLSYVRGAMSEVVNGVGTARRARLPLDNIKLGGKTGTAQVVSLKYGRGGRDVPWKFRDHGLFVCFAPVDNPRYACAVVIQHGGGSGAAYPVARDVMTFLYDREKAMENLEPLEEAWGGDIKTRMDRKLAEYRTNLELEKAIAEGRQPPPAAEEANAANDSAQLGQ
ncbi:MAG: penicillin-binding transpeptidase domain-containing protein, partial [Pseudomonadota bacterium]